MLLARERKRLLLPGSAHFKMATNYNSDLSNELRKAGAIQISVDQIPQKINDSIQPVIEVNPKLLKNIEIIKIGSASDATSATIYTTPSNQDFYLCGFTFTHCRDATATSLVSEIKAYVNGEQISLYALRTLTTTVINGFSFSVNLLRPIKIDRGTSLIVTNGAATALIRSTAIIYGYLDNTSSS